MEPVRIRQCWPLPWPHSKSALFEHMSDCHHRSFMPTTLSPLPPESIHVLYKHLSECKIKCSITFCKTPSGTCLIVLVHNSHRDEVFWLCSPMLKQCTAGTSERNESVYSGLIHVESSVHEALRSRCH